MNYEKAYKEALEKATKLHSETEYVCEMEMLEQIFPELKESEDEKIRKELINFFSKGAGCDSSTNGIKDRNIIAWLEKQGEQKPTEKVESKFKTGDWITVVNDEGGVEIEKVVEFLGNKVRLIDTDGVYTLCPQVWLNDYHLWTIQDAKDGDVLAADEIESHPSPFVAIYKKQDGELFETYCFIGHDGKFYKGEIGHAGEYVHPATKEQRDTLEKAMLNAEYKWDAEKKELKKIDQNPAWSEDDNKNLNSVRRIIENSENLNKVFETIDSPEYIKKYFIDWLKSLKDRVHPQPKQEWSEDALKDLPKWKKATEDKKFDKHVCIMDYYMVPFLDTEVNEGDYYIELSDLKILPKEE